MHIILNLNTSYTKSYYAVIIVKYKMEEKFECSHGRSVKYPLIFGEILSLL